MTETAATLDPNLSRRARKREATRDRIRTVALDLFAKHGFENVTVLQIAAEADVDATTFWRHFRTKLDTLCTDQDLWAQQFRDTLVALPADMPLIDAAIQAMIETPLVSQMQLLDIRAQLGSATPSVDTQNAVLAIDNVMRGVLIDGLSQRLGVDAATDPRPSIMSGAIVSAMHWYSAQYMSGQVPEMADASVQVRDAILGTFLP